MALTHRVASGRRAGQCRQCGQHDLRSAPAGCVLCAFMSAREAAGTPDPLQPAVLETADILKLRYDEFWSALAQRLARHGIAGDRFYLFAAHDDGEPLDTPPHLERPFATVTAAQDAARGQLARYPHVWIVTAVGAWRVTG